MPLNVLNCRLCFTATTSKMESESVWSRWNLFSCTLQMFLTSCYILSSDFIKKLCRLGLKSSRTLQPSNDQSWTVPRRPDWTWLGSGNEKPAVPKKMDGVVLLFWWPFGNLLQFAIENLARLYSWFSYWTWWFSIVMSTLTRPGMSQTRMTKKPISHPRSRWRLAAQRRSVKSWFLVWFL